MHPERRIHRVTCPVLVRHDPDRVCNCQTSDPAQHWLSCNTVRATDLDAECTCEQADADCRSVARTCRLLRECGCKGLANQVADALLMTDD